MDPSHLKRKKSDDSITDVYLDREFKRPKVLQNSTRLNVSSATVLSQASSLSDVFYPDGDIHAVDALISGDESGDSVVGYSDENVNNSNIGQAKSQSVSQPSTAASIERKSSSSSSSTQESASGLLSALTEIIAECKETIRELAARTDQNFDEDETLKEYLLPAKKSALFLDGDLANKERIRENVSEIIEKAREDSPELFTDDELELFDAFAQLDTEAQQFFLLLLLKRDRWTLEESINGFKNFQALKDELLESDLILDCLPQNFSTLEEALYLFDSKELNQFAKANKRTVLKSKVKMINSIVLFARSSRALNGEDLERTKINEACETLSNKSVFRINGSKSKIFWKAILINFAAPKFDKTVYAHFKTFL